MSAGKRYSAGAIFLQVVPVFANVQKDIEREAERIDKSLGDKMEQSGERAGRRAGKAASKGLGEEFGKGSKALERDFRDSVDRMGDHLANVPVNRLSNAMRREITQVKKDLESVGKLKVESEIDVANVHRALESVESRVKKIRAGSKIDFRGDFTDMLAGLNKVHGALRDSQRQASVWERSIQKSITKTAATLDGKLSPELKEVRDDLIALSNLRVDIEISDTQLLRETEVIKQRLDELSKTKVSPQVDLATAAARAELTEWLATAAAASAQDIDIDVDVDTTRARAGLLGLKRDGEDTANSFRSFNFVLLAAAGAGPALIPILGAIAGALIAIAPAAAVAVAGLSAVIIGFSGIGGAVQALQAKQDQMAQSTQQSAKTEASSARAIARARESAADAVENALERQVDAQRAYAKSLADVKEAEADLLDARNAAKDDGKQLELDIKNNQLDLDQGLIDSFDATVNYNAVMSDGSSTNKDKEQARIQMEQAKLRLEELRLKAKELAADKAKWDKQGVDGTDAVQTAQERLNDAIERQKKAYRDLGDAARAVDEARRDGAQRVSDALAAQAEALGAVNSQQANVDAAFDKLGLSGQKFALFLFELRKGFRAFRDDIQEAMLPGVQSAIEGFLSSSSGKVAREALIALAGAFGRFAQALSQSFQGQAWMGFFEMLRDIGPDIQAAYGDAFIMFLEALASLMTTSAPFALEFAEGLAAIMGAFADWAASKEGQEGLLRFLDWVQMVGPDVLDFFGSLVGALVNLGVALAPVGLEVLKGITAALGFIAEMDPKILAALGAALITMLVASQVAYGLQLLSVALIALLSGTLGPVVFLVIGLAAALVYLYKTNEDFRDFIQKVWKVIAKAFTDAWETIKPALDNLGAKFEELWNEHLKPFMDWLMPILWWLIKTIIPLWGWVWANTMTFIINSAAMAIEGLGHIFDFFGWLYEDVLVPIWDGMAWAWDRLMDGLAWAWENVLEPALDAMGDGLDALGDAFQAAVDGIAAVWRTLRRIVATPIKFLLETVINNGLIAGFNEVASWVGLGGKDGKVIGDVQIPAGITKYSYATGGVLPGYTPGRDVHKFYSPTAGGLELSGGEAIMRPEWTAAMGKSGVDYWNGLAKSGGVKAVKQAMGSMGFWNGGILPLLKGNFVPHKKGQYPGFAGDLNYGSGYDDYGKPVQAWKKGIVAQQNYIGDDSYGRWVVLNHGGGQNSLYAHLSQFGANKVGDTVAAGQMIGRVGDIGNTGTPPTSHLHFEINGGTVDYADTATSDGRSIPGFMWNLVKDPLAYVKNLILDPMRDAASAVTGSPIWPVAKRAPLMLAEKATDKMWDIIPGWVKTAAGWAGDAAEWVVGGVKNVGGAAVDIAKGVGGAVVDGAGAVGNFLGLADGGILPYNGTMKYDSGGYLPPGLTNVVNLTGKPEPVFTNDQWDGMTGGPGGGTIHYEPHFEGSNLTAEDVAGDMNFTFRRLGRSGKYGGLK